VNAHVPPRPGASRTLIAGIGNIFLGDDGFGVEVVHRLDPSGLPDGVEVADVGIRGVHLAYTLLDGRYDTLVIVDAVPSGHPPGTVTVVRPDPPAFRPRAGADLAESPEISGDPEVAAPPLDAHGMSPDAVLGLMRTLGGELDEVLVVGCEPAFLAERMELSTPVRAAVDEAVVLIGEIVRGMRLAEGGPGG
jgi:hydrogenase maturation protease